MLRVDNDLYYFVCSILPAERCGGTFFAPEGNFTSPLYPDSYPNNIKCVWKIATDPERRIAVGVTDDNFHVEQGTSKYSCNLDRISVYNGESKIGRRFGSYCGTGMRTFQTVYSTGRFLHIEFKTNSRERRSGFNLHYKTFFASE